jgi:hypothetical protein
MPWQLTTAIDVGDMDTSDYTQVRIVRFDQDILNGRIIVYLQYGNTVEGNWVPGLVPKSKAVAHEITGASYTSLVENSEPNEGESTYDAVKRALYQHLADANVIAAGTLS